MERADVVIGGGGIIGLTVALELAQEGFRVKVIERGRAMEGASWAAAGMLAVEDPENPPELAELATLSGKLYPDYLSTLERLSGQTIPLRTRNVLQGTRPNGKFHCETTVTRVPISPEEAVRRVPGVEPASRSLLWLDEPSLDPRDLCRALPAAAKAAGVVLEEQTEIVAVDGSAGSVAITTSRGLLSAAAFVNCCGAWAATVQQSRGSKGRIAGAPDIDLCPGANPALSVVPRKGQMATVLSQGDPQLQHVVRTPEIYLVPRGDGRIVIGATVEDAGFDLQVEAAAIDRLLSQAAELWPPVRPAAVIDKWAGIRPGTIDDLPLIGNAGSPNCWLATGHFRNGILLAPGTGRVVRQLIEGKPTDAVMDAFAVERLSSC